jgi:hypothetical protein
MLAQREHHNEIYFSGRRFYLQPGDFGYDELGSWNQSIVSGLVFASTPSA